MRSSGPTPWRLFAMWSVLVLLLTTSSSAEKFKSAAIVPTPTTPKLLVSADLNGDGRLDFVYLDSSNSVKVMLATSPKSYGPAQSVALPSSSYFATLTTSDVNADGRNDLIVAGSNGGQGLVAVLLGNGDGTFQPAILSTAIVNHSIDPCLDSVAVADFDEDGKEDIAITNGSGEGAAVIVMKGNGFGSFTPLYQSVDVNPSIKVQAADLNKDGHMDLVVDREPANDIVVYMGDGKGGFVPTVYDYFGNSPNPNVPPYMNSAVIADMNGDGYPDLVVGTGTSGLQILLNDGTGHFALARAGTGVALPDFQYILAAADFNHDGKLDLAGGYINGLQLFSGNGDLTFQNACIYAVPLGHPGLPGAIAVDDFDGDGVLDFASFTEGGIVVAYGNSNGSFQAAKSYDFGSRLHGAVVADLNRDGIPDIVGATYSGPVVLLGKGNGDFSAALTTAPLSSSALAVGDFNGDGKPDVILLGEAVEVYLGNGDGSFQAPASYIPLLLEGMIAGDFNNDGKPDVGYGSSFSFQSILNSAKGLFPSGIPTKNVGPGIVVGDFNNDGKSDVAFGESGRTDVTVLLGNGDGTFQSPILYPLPNPPFDLFLADLNRDGKPDLVATVGLRNEFGILYGKGDGTFSDATLIPTPGVSYVNGEADFLKGDSNEDLVFSDGFFVSVLNGNGDGTFQAPVKYFGGGTPGKPLIADFNGDGKLDVAVPNVDVNGGSVITVLLNCGGTSTKFTDSPAPQSFYGQPITFAVTLNAVGQVCGTPTGTISFTDNGAPLKIGNLSGGQFSFTTSSLSVGPHIIGASYSGDPSFDGQALRSVNHTIIAPVVIINGSPQQPLTKDGSGNLVAQVTITNNGNVRITSTQVTMAGTTLGSPSLLSAPPPVTNLAPGASAIVTLTFPNTAALSAAKTATLKVSGTYSVPSVQLNGNWVLSFRSVSLK